MATKLKKVKSAGRFGARYGKTVKAKLIAVETKQRVKQICPFCERPTAKRKANGIWACKTCKKTFADNTYYIGEKK